MAGEEIFSVENAINASEVAMTNHDKIGRFFTACDELIGGKFILADAKIGELLRAVATSEELTRLFAAVTDGYNYPAAKEAYLKEPDSRRRLRGEAFLPSDRSEVLAFVFCLLAEIDSGKLRFNDFLLRYFYEDGSYTASYALFVGRMIRPFRDIVRDCFPEREKKEPQAVRREEEALLGKLAEKISLEKARVSALSLKEEDAIAAERILSGLYASAGRGDVEEIKALLCGYLYFLQATGVSDANSDEVFRLAAEI